MAELINVAEVRNVAEINPGEEKINRGFIDDEAKEWELRSKFFPSKVGGKPAWLALDDLPKNISCRLCKGPMLFLLQLYLPDSRYDHGFHRTIFIFACPRGQCSGRAQESRGLRVFRSTLPSKNEFYSMEPPEEVEENSESPSADERFDLCDVCGCLADDSITGLRDDKFCSEEHRDNRVTTFREAEIYWENVDEEDGDLSPEQVENQLKELKEKYPNVQIDMNPENDQSTQELENICGKEEPVSTAFIEYCQEEPEQVIRFARGRTPIYCAPKHIPKSNHIGECSICGDKRQFEFQVMPNLLNFLKVDGSYNEMSFDFTTLLVYTCYCEIKQGYVEEKIFKQDFIEDEQFKKKQQAMLLSLLDADADADTDDEN